VLVAALPALVALVVYDISMAYFPAAQALGARFVDAAIALPGEATAYAVVDAAVASCVTETDAVMMAVAVVTQTANATAAHPGQPTVHAQTPNCRVWQCFVSKL
jgi:hypothetical protein